MQINLSHGDIVFEAGDKKIDCVALLNINYPFIDSKLLI